MTTTPTPLMQSAEMQATLRACGQAPLRLADGTLVLRRRFFPGVTVAMLSRAWIDPATLPGLIRQAGLNHAPLILSPDHPAPGLTKLGAVPLVTPTCMAELDLRGDLRAGLHQKWRNALVQAERSPLRITRRILGDRSDNWLLTADQAQQRARGYRNWPVPLTLAYARANPGKAVEFSATDGDTVAAMLFLCHGAIATYHIGCTTARGRWMNAHRLILWQAMRWLAKRGFQRLDLGPVSTEDAPGLARFKLGTGARARWLGGTWGWWPPLGRSLRPLAGLDRGGMRWTDPHAG